MKCPVKVGGGVNLCPNSFSPAEVIRFGEVVDAAIFNAALTSNLTDSVSSTTANFVRAGSIYVFDNSDVLQTYGVDTAGYGSGGLFCDGATTNDAGANYRTPSAWGGTAGAVKNIVGIDGVSNAGTTLSDSGATTENRNETVSISNSSDPVTISRFIKKDSDESRFPRLGAQLVGGTTVQYFIDFNTKTGFAQSGPGSGTFAVHDVGDFWLVCITVTNNSSGNTLARIFDSPAFSFPIGTTNASLTGSIGYDWAQIEDGKAFCSSPFPGGSSRATQAGSGAGNGTGWPLASLDAAVTTALSDTGSITATFTPSFDYDQISAGNYGIATFNDDATSGIFHDGSGNISINDGTNTVSALTQWSHGDEIEITATWTGSTLTMKTVTNSGAPVESSGSFDGAIPANDTLRLAVSNEFPHFLKSLKIYDTVVS